MKRLSLMLALALTASLIALVLAPMLLAATTALGLVLPLPGALEVAAVRTAYDIGVWGPGLGMAIVGGRLGWIRGWSWACVITAAPALAEAVVLGILAMGSERSRIDVVVGCIAIAIAIVTASRQAGSDIKTTNQAAPDSTPHP